MKKNLSRFEAVLRMALGCSLFYFFILGGPVWAIGGVYLMLTSSFRFCPAYYYLGNRVL